VFIPDGSIEVVLIEWMVLQSLPTGSAMRVVLLFRRSRTDYFELLSWTWNSFDIDRVKIA